MGRILKRKKQMAKLMEEVIQQFLCEKKSALTKSLNFEMKQWKVLWRGILQRFDQTRLKLNRK